MKTEKLKFVLDKKNLCVELNEESETSFDKLIQNRWLHLMSSGHFRYNISKVESRKVGQFVVQLNPMRATTRRKPQSMESVRQNFDPDGFNFTKGTKQSLNYVNQLFKYLYWVVCSMLTCETSKKMPTNWKCQIQNVARQYADKKNLGKKFSGTI